MYSKGRGVPKDDKTAVKWYRFAAEQGYARAQTKLGWIYFKGRGVPKDYKTAVKWYRLAAEQGNVYAQGQLSSMYFLGRGVLKDYVYAHMWASISGTNGKNSGAKLRNFFEKKMTPAAISAARKLALECIRKKYKGC
jgi:TPR repeat protein